MAILGQSDLFFKCLVFILLVVLTLFIAVNNFSPEMTSSFSRLPSSHFKGERERPMPEELGVTNVDLCPSTVLSARDKASVQEFNARCHGHVLTRLPKRDSPNVESGIGETLSFIARNPRAHPCTCPRSLKVADFPIRTTGLVSYPGSGNTWTRHLIQQLTGIHSGSIYKFSSIKTEGFPYEGVTRNVSVVKSHRPPDPYGRLTKEYVAGSSIEVDFDQLIILVRNPYAALMAEFKRGSLKLGKVQNGFIDSDSPIWKSFAKKSSLLWRRFIKEAFSTTLPSLVVFYEDLRTCLLPELVKMASFLQNRNLMEFSFCCTLKEQEGTFHRPPSNQTIYDVYSRQQREKLNDILLQAVVSYVKPRHPEVVKRFMQYYLP